MRILQISPLCPLPLEKGGAVRIWNIAKQLSLKHEVDLVCFIRDESERIHEKELLAVFRKVTFIQRQRLVDSQFLLSSLRNLLTFFTINFTFLMRVLFSNRPFLSLLYDSGELRQYLIEKDNGEYDLFYAETYYSIASIKDLLGTLKTKVLLIEQNIESLVYTRHATSQKNPLLKIFMNWDVRKLESEEIYYWKNASIIGGLSTNDCSYIQSKSGKQPITVPNGVDVRFFSEHVSERIFGEILFVGTLDYIGNTTALRWILDEIWDKIGDEIKRRGLDYILRLRIVGRSAGIDLREHIANKGFVIDEDVNDIRTAFQHATILLAPIRVGSGTKYKVLEALASHLTVVTTDVGAEGLGVVSGTELLISNTAQGLAEAVVDLLGSEFSREQLAQNGYNFVTENFDWKNIVDRFEQDLSVV